MTKEQALRETAELWRWLARFPLLGKEDWPGWARKKPRCYHCACCEFVYRKSEYEPECATGEDGMQLSLCPLNNAWPNGCLMGTSPFLKWWYNEGKERVRRKAALQIVRACERELRKIKGKKQ